ncbi:MAG: TetR-like C-terminal domain-containing protein [Myxococcota bacterium]
MDDSIDRIREALARGELSLETLTARTIAACLGKTTSVLYHHWGSLDGFLYAVAQSGFVALAAEIVGRPPQDAAERYIRFAVAQPALYALMFHRSWDWAALREGRDLRASPGFALWSGAVAELARRGSPDPETDARALYGGLHGLASLAITGRANVGQLDQTDVDAAIRAARRLVDLLTPESP